METSMETSGYVYFLEFKNRKGLKIGKASILKNRLKELVASHGPITRGRYLLVPNSEATLVEKSIQKKYNYVENNTRNDGFSEFYDTKMETAIDGLTTYELSETLRKDVNKTSYNPKVNENTKESDDVKITLTFTKDEMKTIQANYGYDFEALMKETVLSQNIDYSALYEIHKLRGYISFTNNLKKKNQKEQNQFWNFVRDTEWF